MSALPKSSWLLTVEEYLASEEVSDIRHEYVDGQIYALAGASQQHVEIVGNIFGNIWTFLRGRPCRVMSNDMRVQAAERIYYYPDVVVTCDPDDRDPLFVCKPVVAVEVLSPTTALVDRREKEIHYREIPSMLCYLLVEQNQQRVERYWRDEVDAEWRHEVVIGRSVHIPGIDFDLGIDDIYEGIDFEPAS